MKIKNITITERTEEQAKNLKELMEWNGSTERYQADGIEQGALVLLLVFLFVTGIALIVYAL
jgi:shikimate 5-dehydrogenase